MRFVKFSVAELLAGNNFELFSSATFICGLVKGYNLLEKKESKT